MTSWNIHQAIPKRYILCLLAFFGFANSFILRSNLSIAIIAMVKPSNDQLANNISLSNSTDFDWNSKTEAYILSSFFYGYALIQIPAGFLATKYGGKFMFGGGVGICGLLTLLTPICARKGPTALIILRIFEGLSCGCVLPSLHSLWSKWAPRNEKAKLVTFALSGFYVGTFLTMMFGGIIAAYWSWEWIFYLSGGLAIIWAIFWFYCIAESPSTHPTITIEEVTYIESNIHRPPTQKYSIPWKAILTSLPVWATIAVHFGCNWIVYSMLTELPTFLTYCLGYRVDEAGAISSIPWLPLAISVYATGYLSDKLINRYSTVYIRKLTIMIAFISISLAILLVTLLNSSHHTLIIIGIIIAVTSSGLSTASVNVNHLDIGAQYAGILIGISNCVAMIPGFLAPMLTGHLVPHTNIKQEWNRIFVISIFICVVTLLFYTFFGAGELQPWVKDATDEYQPVSNKSLSREKNIDDLTDRVHAEINNENKNIQ